MSIVTDTGKNYTRSWWRLKHLRSEPIISLRENQNKEKETFLKTASSGTLPRVLENLGELYKILDHRLLLEEVVI